jgi:hypothetical protein
MPATQTAGAIRKFVTRTLAAGSLLAIYAVGTVVTTGAMLTATTTAADAQYYRGYRRGRGRGYRRGYRGRGVLVCRHRYYSSRRVCYRRW